MVTLYLVLVASLYMVQGPIIELLVAAPEIRQSASDMLRLLLPSYVLVAFVVFSHVILENLGRGIRVFVWTVALEAGTVFALLKYGQDVNLLVTILVGSALVYALVFAAEYGLLVRAQGRVRALIANDGIQAT
jgi:Na+-driven multidrug efflux pump